MSCWNFWKCITKRRGSFRKIKTIRGQKAIDNAIAKGTKLIIRNVQPFSAVKGKYCIVRDKKSGKEFEIYDFRDERVYSDDFEKVMDWTYQYHSYDFPQEAAYIIPNDIKEGEIVMVDDLIENFLGYHYNQGGSDRLKSCKAIWKNNDLQILYNPDIDCIRVVG